MKKATKVILIVSLCMILSGIFVCVGALSMSGVGFENIFKDNGVVNSVVKVTTSDEAFENVDVNVNSADVQVFASTCDEWKVESTEYDKVHYQVEVKDDTLVIRRVDERKWYEHIGIDLSFISENVKIYLPEKMFESIELKSTSGSVTVNEGLTCESLVAKSTSGAVRVYSVTAEDVITAKTTSGQVSVAEVFTGKLEASSTSGRVNVSNIEQINTVVINATSGKIEATDINCREFTAENVSGGVLCSGVIAQDNINAESTSGSIKILRSDAETLNLKSTSGSIRGTLLSDKIFIADSSSGSVKVPQTTQGGICKAKTTSGSIDITIE